jgi:hypothetical protein
MPPLGAVTIPDQQVRLHVVGESLALIFVVPAMTYLATRKDVPGHVRAIAGGTALFSLLVDGWLLYQYAKKSPGWWGN